MSGWGWNSDEQEYALTLADMQEALPPEDAAAFNALMVKAMQALDQDNDGLVTQLRETVADLRTKLSTTAFEKVRLAEALKASELKRERFEAQIGEKLELLSMPQGALAVQQAEEIKRLQERVAIQRQIIGRLEDQKGPAGSAWSLFAKGVTSAFVNPLGAAMKVRT
jgi:hypothetical protein